MMGSVYEKASAKAAWRLIPFLILCYFVAYLDRVNAGFAALTMNKELGLTAEMFGFGVGIFFFGYFIFEVPSNLLLEKVGARLWIARIMISWGVISAAFAFVGSISATFQSLGFSFFDSARTFYLLRFIFGAAEAGFFPGIILFLTYWFTSQERARWVGVFMAAIPLSAVIGGPVSGLILDTFDGVMGLSGWQWMFVMEGVPAVLVGLWVLSYLTDKPGEAEWLEPQERVALQARLDDERNSREAIRRYTLGEALTNPRVLALSVVYFGIVSGNYGLSYWLPQIVKGVASDIGLDKVTGMPINSLTGYLVAVPFAFAIVAMILWTRHSDATQERVWHVAGPAIVGGLSLVAAAYLGSPSLAAVALIVGAMGIYAAVSTFWTLPTGFPTGSAAAGGIALINSIGNLGGFVGPYAIGWIKDATGETTLGLVVLAACLIMAGVVTFCWATTRRSSWRQARCLRSEGDFRQRDSRPGRLQSRRSRMPADLAGGFAVEQPIACHHVQLLGLPCRLRHAKGGNCARPSRGRREAAAPGC
jgi:MFS transporter, ACS family, tartrate transporter